MRAETFSRSQPWDRQEIHRLYREMANWVQLFATIASIRQSHPSVQAVQYLRLPNDSSKIKRTPPTSLLPALLLNKSWRCEIVFQANRGSLANRGRSSVGYLKLLLLSRTSKKVKDAKNIRIARDAMYARALLLEATPGYCSVAISAKAGATI